MNCRVALTRVEVDGLVARRHAAPLHSCKYRWLHAPQPTLFGPRGRLFPATACCLWLHSTFLQVALQRDLQLVAVGLEQDRLDQGTNGFLANPEALKANGFEVRVVDRPGEKQISGVMVVRLRTEEFGESGFDVFPHKACVCLRRLTRSDRIARVRSLSRKTRFCRRRKGFEQSPRRSVILTPRRP